MTYFLQNLKAYVRVSVPIFLGVGIGFFMAIHAQRKMSEAQRVECQTSNYRRLITLQTTVGEADYCIPLQYLAR
jgi:hypothetical protein